MDFPLLYKLGVGMPPGPDDPGPPEIIINMPPKTTINPASGVDTFHTINENTLLISVKKSDMVHALNPESPG